MIVTEKLLTGFDAPVLYCMYLDKPMRDHVLLQAIARVNRPYEDQAGRPKPAGFVLDFVGIFAKLEQALAFDSEDVYGVIEGLEVLQERFVLLIADGKSKYLTLWRGKSEDKAVEAVLEHFRDGERRQQFYRYYRELQELYEIISPDPFLRPYLEDYETLTRVYRIARAAYEPYLDVDKSFLRKTKYLVQEHVRTGRLRETGPIYKLDAETLEEIADQDKPDIVKVFNLIKAIHDLVKEQRTEAPYLTSIGERAQAIARAFEEYQLTSQEALGELEKLVEECREAEKKRKDTDLPPEGFAVSWYLEKQGVAEAEAVARKAAAAFERFPHWQRSQAQARDVRKDLYKALIDAEVEEVVEFADRIMNMLRRSPL